MKSIAVLIGSIIVLAFGFAPEASYANTPDGATPANEGVCDSLSTDGVTKGLYGLCVAFCEAQDWTNTSNPITEAELEALLNAAPSGRILANYNKKKRASDPDMPCIVVETEEPCPCWSGAELTSIDGIIGNNGSALLQCANSGSYVSIAEETGDMMGARQQQLASVARTSGGMMGGGSETATCAYRNEQVSPFLQRQIEIDSAVADMCQAQITDRCAAL